jgi:hypothetical protein
MQKIFILSLFIQVVINTCFAQNITNIQGWVSVKDNRSIIASTQKNNTDGKMAIYQVRKQVTITEDIADWFTANTKADIQKEKWTETIIGNTNVTNDVYLYLTEIKDEANKKWYLLYLAHGFGKNQSRLARFICSSELDFFKEKGRDVSTHFGNLALEDIKVNTGKGDLDEPIATKPSSPIIKNKKPVIEIQTGKGVKREQIHAVIMHLEYEAGMGGAIYPVYNAYILLKDRSIYKHPITSPTYLDIAASKISEPKKWGIWKQNGTTIITYWPTEKPRDQNGTWEKKSYYNTLPAKQGEHLEGSFKTLTGGGNTALGGDVLVVASANITFNQQGKFTLAKSAGVSSGSETWENSNSKIGEAGTYILDEYSIVLNYNNGKTERRFFFFYPDSRKHFGIGQSVYMPLKK